MENNFNFDDNSSSNRELVMQLLSAFNSFKQKLEDPNYIQFRTKKSNQFGKDMASGKYGPLD